jgi:hypothetical protein
MTIERSRQLGRLLMAASGVALALFLAGVVRRSYLALAIPLAIATGTAAGLLFWIGYTMATTRWETDEFADLDVPEAEGAPPPDVLGER